MTSINKILVFVAALFISVTAKAQDDEYTDDDIRLDSLVNAALSMPEDTNRLALFNTIASEHYNNDSTLKYAQLEYDLAVRLGHHRYTLWAMHFIAWCQYYNSEFTTSISTNMHALELMSDDEEPLLRTLFYINVADSYSMMMDNDKAVEFYRKALDVAQSHNLSHLTFSALNNIAQALLQYRLYDEALINFNKAYDIAKSINSYEAIADIHSGMGCTYSSMATDSGTINTQYMTLAKEHLLKASKLYTDSVWIGNETVVASYSNLTLRELSYFAYTGDKKKQIINDNLSMIDRALALDAKLGSTFGASILKLVRVNNYIADGRYKLAEQQLDSLANLFDMSDYSNSFVGDILESYISLYRATGNYKSLSVCLDRKINYNAETYTSTYATKVTRAVVEVEQNDIIRKHDMEAMRREGELQASARWRMYVIALLAIVAVMAISSSVRRLRHNRKLNEQNEMLLEQQEEITTQNESLEYQKSVIEVQNIHLESQNRIITENNNQMIAGLRYASLIQKAAMPTDVQMQLMIGDSFVVFRPLNIVSGDFYWAANIGGCRILVVADCTGHGVPGAFLSMLGISILNDISNEIELGNLSAADILERMNDKFKAALRQNEIEEAGRDGIDMAIVAIEPDSSHLHYAGAFRPLIVVSDRHATRYAPDRISIGASIHEGRFTDNVIDVKKDDIIYLFSDGITDQFGFSGSGEAKYTLKRLMQQLEDMSSLPMSSQKAKIEIIVDQWRLTPQGTLCDQIDDILIAGCRI